MTVKDYLGNEIAAGMVIKIIRTKPILGDISEIKRKKNGNGYFKPKVIFKQPKECWDCVGEYPVHKNDKGELRYTVESDWATFDYPLSSKLLLSQPVDIITIKGLSDLNPKLK